LKHEPISLDTSGYVHSIESFSTSDGPGTRCVLFLQGCALRCRYCHNPDTWEKNIGAPKSARHTIEQALRFRPYWRNGGGVTLSGGEPLLQSRFAEALAKGFHEKGVHVAIDTSGFIFDEHVRNAIAHAQLVILDIKHTDPEKHLWLTTKPLAPILRFLDYLSSQATPFWIRQVVLPGFNDSPDDMDDLANLIQGRAGLERVELLPFHNLATSKWESLGYAYTLGDTPSPSAETMNSLEARLREHGLPVHTVLATPLATALP